MLLAVQVFGQSRAVTGVVKDENGVAIPFATVKIRGAKGGTQTLSDGTFTINVPSGKTQLEISNIGYATQFLNIPDGGVVNVSLAKASTVIEDVVITGYTTQKKSSVTGAVAVVPGAELHDLPVTDIGNLLQGKAPGVQVTAANGAPGQGSFIRIRGVGSISAGSDPLFVIDGVATDASQYNMINPNDIESINILKDASSSAIYGARGANGVIVISTRKGHRGQPQVNFHSEYSVQSRIPDNFKLMTSAQKLQYEYDLDYTNPYMSDWLDSIGTATGNANIDIQSVPLAAVHTEWDRVQGGNTDWFKVLLQDATLAKNELSVSGADDKFSYFASYNNTYQEGIIKSSNYNRNGGRLNLTYKAYDWLTVGANTNFAAFTIHQTRDRYNVQNPLVAAYNINPYEPEFNPDGTYNLTSVGFPIAQALYDNPAFTQNNVAQGAYYLAVRPIKGLEIKSQIGLNYVDQSSEAYTEPGSYLDLILNGVPTGIKTDGGAQTFNYVWANTANYTRSFGEGHNIGLLIGSEYTKEHGKTFSFTSQGFPTATLSTQDNGAKPLTTTSSKYDWSLFSLFIKPSYNYKEKYYIDISARRDGSSRFGADNQYGNFFSGGLGWDIAKENFIKSSDAVWLNQLKVRASVGTSGNFNIGNYASQNLYSFGSYNGLSAAVPNQLANPNLSWEKQRAITAGVDFGFFKSRLTGSIDYYNQNRDNLLQNVPLPSTVGFTSLTENLGAMTNKGWEFAVNYDVLKTRDWLVSIGGNISLNKNVITKLTGQPGDSSGVIPSTATGANILKIGQPYLTYYMVRSAGVDAATGDPLYYDLTGKSTNVYSSSYTTTLNGKSPLPKYFGGINASATFKGITLSALLYFSGGNYIYNAQYESLTDDGSNIYAEQAVAALNYWKKPGDVGVQPKPAAFNPNYFTTDRYLQKGDFARLRDVTISYSLPKSILMKTKVVQNLNIYVTGHNLFTYRPDYKGDPEVGIGSAESDPGTLSNGYYSLFSYPNYRSFTAGVNVTF
jgi:TonB-linked SusC/RagA family outer membrane protein